MKMRQLFLVMGLVVSLAGCANVRNAYDTLTGASVDTRTVYIAAQSFNALEASATNYLRLKKCSSSTTVVCRDLTVTAKLVPAIRSGRKIRDELEDFLRDHPGQLGPRGLYDALVSTTNVIRDLIPNGGTQ